MTVGCYFNSVNVFSPVSPSQMDWSTLYPQFFAPMANTEGGEPAEKRRCIESGEPAEQRRVEFADVGCGYGGLLGKHIIFAFKLSTITSTFACLTQQKLAWFRSFWQQLSLFVGFGLKQL